MLSEKRPEGPIQDIMTIRLTLVSAPISLRDRYGVFSGAANTEPSFGLVCLAAVAQRAGVEVAIVEAASENLSVEQTIREVLKLKPDVVGITSTTAGISAAGTLARQLKQERPHLLTLIGGCHASALPGETLLAFRGFDMAVIGEGEHTLCDILEHVEGDANDRLKLPGTAVREGDSVRINPPRPLIPNLDEMPLPSWSLRRVFRVTHTSTEL